MIYMKTFYGNVHSKGELTSYTVYTASFSLTPYSEKMVCVAGAAGTVDVTLPDATQLPLGGVHFYVLNTSAIRLARILDSGATVLATLDVKVGAIICLVVNGTSAGTWFIKTKALSGI